MPNLDKTVHDMARATETIPWNDFCGVGVDEELYDYYYAEECLYLIRDRITGAIFFAKARGPADALKLLKERFKVSAWA